MTLIPQFKEIKGQAFCHFKIIFIAIKHIPFLYRFIGLNNILFYRPTGDKWQ